MYMPLLLLINVLTHPHRCMHTHYTHTHTEVDPAEFKAVKQQLRGKAFYPVELPFPPSPPKLCYLTVSMDSVDSTQTQYVLLHPIPTS